MREMVPTEPPVKRGWSSAPRRLLPRFHRPALAEGSAPGAPPAGAPTPRPPPRSTLAYSTSRASLAKRDAHPAPPCRLCASHPALQSHALHAPAIAGPAPSLSPWSLGRCTREGSPASLQHEQGSLMWPALAAGHGAYREAVKYSTTKSGARVLLLGVINGTPVVFAMHENRYIEM